MIYHDRGEVSSHNYKGRKLITGTDRDIFGWLTLNNCPITSCQAMALAILAENYAKINHL